MVGAEAVEDQQTEIDMTTQEHDQRIGVLMRKGRPVYYAIFGQAMIESADREHIIAALDKHEAKLAEWDRNRR